MSFYHLPVYQENPCGFNYKLYTHAHLSNEIVFGDLDLG